MTREEVAAMLAPHADVLSAEARAIAARLVAALYNSGSRPSPLAIAVTVAAAAEGVLTVEKRNNTLLYTEAMGHG